MKARYLACISYVINTHSIHTIAATLHHFATDWGPPWNFWIISSLSWRSYVFNTVAEFVSTVTVRIQLLFLSLFCWTCFFCRPQWIRFIFSIAFQRTMIARGKFWYMQKIKDLLQKNEIPTFIAEPMPGKDIVEITKARNLQNSRCSNWDEGIVLGRIRRFIKDSFKRWTLVFVSFLQFPLVSLFSRCSFLIS